MSRYARPNIQAMQGYTWGEQPQDKLTVKLNTNENPYPPTPAVTKTLQQLSGELFRTYPNPTADRLRDGIANHHGVKRHNVVVTNGGDEALRLAMTTFVNPKSHFGMAEPSYSLYPVLADIHDAQTVKIDLDEAWQLPADFADQLNQQKVELTCVVNPHAPSGTLYSTQQMELLAANLNGVLLIDEAYVDFVDDEYRSEELIARHDNVLILRTFSKGYSLAGLRLGYLLGHQELIAPIINKSRDSYNIDYVSQAVGLAAIEDQAYAQQTWQQVRQERQRLQLNLAQLGLFSPPSQSNFVLATIDTQARLTAKEIYHALKEKHILVRYFEQPRLDDKLRISIGTAEQNNHLIEILTDLLT